jgi:hypothetical protein
MAHGKAARCGEIFCWQFVMDQVTAVAKEDEFGARYSVGDPLDKWGGVQKSWSTQITRAGWRMEPSRAKTSCAKMMSMRLSAISRSAGAAAARSIQASPRSGSRAAYRGEKRNSG